MQKRSVAIVVVLTIVTLGIYSLIWHVKTKTEMNSQGADIPTAWLLIVPIANIYWYLKWCSGVEKVTNGKLSAPVAFLLSLLLGVIGMAIIQSTFNNAPAQLPAARVA